MMARYAKFGVEIPDRFDMDPDHLGTEGLRMHKVQKFNDEKA